MPVVLDEKGEDTMFTAFAFCTGLATLAVAFVTATLNQEAG